MPFNQMPEWDKPRWTDYLVWTVCLGGFTICVAWLVILVAGYILTR